MSVVAAARAQRRLTAWDDTSVDFQTADGARSAQLLVGNVADPEKRGCTLIRTLLALQLTPAVPGGTAGVTRVRVGVMLVSDDSFSADAMPDVEQDADFPIAGWVYRDHFLVLNHTTTAGPPHIVEIRRDLRSQRKMDRSTVTIQMHNDSISGAAFTTRLIGLVRNLYKLP